MKTECEDLGPRLSALLDGELPEAERLDVEAHLKTCETCQQLARELGEIVVFLKDTPAPRDQAEVDLTGVWEEIESQLDFGPTIWQRIKMLIGKPVLWVPAAVAAASVAMVVFMRPVPQEQIPGGLSRVESVYSQTGSVMVLQTAKRGQPLVWILPEAGKGVGS